VEPINYTTVRVRIAPSPTGFMHIGNLRTVLYDYLLARHFNGTFIVRVEDTDQTRFVPGAMEDMLNTLAWAGITVDEGPYLDEEGSIKEKGEYGPYIQSHRLGIYQEHIKTLVDKHKAYYCFCTKERIEKLREEQTKNNLPPKYDGLCRDLDAKEVQSQMDKKMPYVVRFRMPDDREIIFNDLIRGTIIFNTKDLDDFVMIKGDGFPTYHFANIIDDHFMKITHVLRGEEWISSTPKHILMYEAYGWHAPYYAHLPQLLNKDKKKMSKREGDVSVKDFIAKGYLKDALLNFISLLGWNSGTDQEIYTLDELIKQFTLEKVHKAGAVFDVDKLDWINGVYIRKMSIDTFVEQSLPYLESAGLITRDDTTIYTTVGRKKTVVALHWLKKVCALEQQRIKRLGELPEALDYFFTANVKITKKLLVWKKSTPAKTKEILENLLEAIKQMPDSDLSIEGIDKYIRAFITANSYENGDVLWPLRYSLSGREKSPSPFELVATMGKDMTVKRLQYALKKLA
jgi:nondiscriminating glutamyl-tRNA synthetase